MDKIQLSKSEGIMTGGALAAALGGVAGVVLLVIILVIVWTRRRRRKPFDLNLEEIHNEAISVKSAPNSRSSSPKLSKRLSCPDAFTTPMRGVVVRSVTVDQIPDFTLPPERVQPPRPNVQALPHSTPLQYQQSLIGNLQPDLYSHSSSFSEEEDIYLPRSTYGRLWYSLVYDAAVEQLNVTLIKVKDLPGRGSHRHPRDPYVKVFVLPDDRTCRTSKVRKKTLSPIFNENFIFSVPTSEVKDRTVRFSVYDVDKRKVRHSLGHVMVPLRDVDLGHVDTYWSDLEAMTQVVSSLGDLQIGLCYQPQTEKIKVTIMRARSLKHADMDLDTRLYLRLQLFYGRKVHRTKRTGSRQSSVDDVDFNESLSFSISGKQLDSCRLEAALMLTTQRHGAPMLAHDVEYGRVVIGPFMYARGEELIHWQEMLSHPRVLVTRWHSLSANVSHE